MSELKELIQVSILALVGTILLVICCMILISPLMILQCNAQFNDFEHKWGILSGCMIKKEGKWINTEYYRLLEN